VARQVRGAFEGAIAKRFGRGDEEVTVKVLLAKAGLDSGSLRDLYVLGPSGAEVPLAEIVSLRDSAGFSRIKREDGKRQVAITGEVDEAVTTNNKVLAAAEDAGLADIASRHRVEIAFKGKAEEQAQTIGDMKIGTLAGLVAIYIILAWVFGNYWTPFGVMAVIPFGVISAILGHLALGFDVTVLSLVALLGLSGIVVNDSIVLVDAYNERRAAGEAVREALINASVDRLRAVLLTSVTTIFGIVTLLFETDLQAQFLKPMAVTIVFGLTGSTLIVLILVPTVLMIAEDMRRLLAGKPARGSREVTASPGAAD
jgi:multidrug efflux pump subunit AcrB